MLLFPYALLINIVVLFSVMHSKVLLQLCTHGNMHLLSSKLQLVKPPTVGPLRTYYNTKNTFQDPNCFPYSFNAIWTSKKGATSLYKGQSQQLNSRIHIVPMLRDFTVESIHTMHASRQ